MKIFTKTSVTFILIQLLVITAVKAQNWSQVPSPNPGPDRNQIRGIAGLSANEVWAVGMYQVTPSGTSPLVTQNLILKWDGTSWHQQTVQNLGNPSNMILDVTAISSSNVWAVGDFANGSNSQAQLMHWNGTSWSNQVVNFPVPGSPWPGSTALEAIDAISATDIWAVGFRAEPNTNLALAYHYNGTSWASVPVPPVGNRHNNFRDVDGLTANDVWAVGSHRSGSAGGQFKPLAMHWNGTAWTNYPMPASLNTLIAELESVKMVAPNDVWAAGTILTGGALLLHWDGTSWNVMNGPADGGEFAVKAPNDIYAVGAFISHWDGTSWTVVDSLKNHVSASLLSATVLPGGEIWAGGLSRDLNANGDQYTLVYKYSNAQNRLTVSASSASVPAGTPVQLLAQPVGTGPFTYQWTAAGTNVYSNPNIANPTVSPTAKTAYAVNVTDQLGNSMQGLVQVKIGSPTGISGNVPVRKVRALPNPFQDNLRLNISVENPVTAQFTLHDVLGREVGRREAQLHAGEHEIPLTGLVQDLRKGYYTLRVQLPESVTLLKLIKE